MNNIQKFDDTVAKLFAELYQNFPRKVEINAFEFMEQDSPEVGIWDQLTEKEQKIYLQQCHEADFLLESVSWLIDNGFVSGRIENSVSTFTSKHCIDLTLTAKGLELLKLVPHSVRERVSIGEELVKVAKSGAKNAGGKLVSEALTKYCSVGQLMSVFGLEQ